MWLLQSFAKIINSRKHKHVHYAQHSPLLPSCDSNVLPRTSLPIFSHLDLGPHFYYFCLMPIFIDRLNFLSISFRNYYEPSVVCNLSVKSMLHARLFQFKTNLAWGSTILQTSNIKFSVTQLNDVLVVPIMLYIDDLKYLPSMVLLSKLKEMLSCFFGCM
jgi:hypothetical protein